MKSVGWLVRKTKRYIHLVSHRDHDSTQEYGMITIPRCAVKKITKLKK